MWCIHYVWHVSQLDVEEKRTGQVEAKPEGIVESQRGIAKLRAAEATARDAEWPEWLQMHNGGSCWFSTISAVIRRDTSLLQLKAEERLRSILDLFGPRPLLCTRSSQVTYNWYSRQWNEPKVLPGPQNTELSKTTQDPCVQTAQFSRAIF